MLQYLAYLTTVAAVLLQPAVQAAQGSNYVKDHYDALDRLNDQLTGFAEQSTSVQPGAGDSSQLVRSPFDASTRKRGADWCDGCYTMTGTFRLNNVRSSLEQVFKDNVNGDFLEAGAWRGGASIFARAVMLAAGQQARRVYVCDSFAGLPRASTPMDNDHWSRMHFLEVSVDEVQNSFEKFKVLDDNVHFEKGFFVHSLPPLRLRLQQEGRKLAVVRGDGDMFESFYDILFNLYDLVPVGGYFICDDCPSILVAEKAIHQFRQHHGITEHIMRVEESEAGTFWRKEKAVEVDYGFYKKWNTTRER